MIVTFTMGGTAVHIVASHVTHFYESDDGGTKIWLSSERQVNVDQATATVLEKLAEVGLKPYSKGSVSVEPLRM